MPEQNITEPQNPQTPKSPKTAVNSVKSMLANVRKTELEQLGTPPSPVEKRANKRSLQASKRREGESVVDWHRRIKDNQRRNVNRHKQTQTKKNQHPTRDYNLHTTHIERSV